LAVIFASVSGIISGSQLQAFLGVFLWSIFMRDKAWRLFRAASQKNTATATLYGDLILTAIIFKNVIVDVTNRLFLTNQAVILTAF
jgi:hypothetical protein